MDKTLLGASGIEISSMALGCMSFGVSEKDMHRWTLGYDKAKPIVSEAFDLGINFFDTANAYCDGTSEEILGDCLQELKQPRDSYVLATKVYYNEGKLSKKAILRECDQSLMRLKTDYVDLYILHRYDYDSDPLETMGAMGELLRKGKIRAIGVSSMFGYQLERYVQAAKKLGVPMPVSMQNHYNLLYREDEREVIPVVQEHGMVLTPYSPLAGGHLTRPTWESDSLRWKSDIIVQKKYDPMRENDMQIIGRVHEVAGRLGVSMAEVALAWLYAKGVAAPLVGATTPERLRELVKACELKLTPEDVSYMEEPYRAHELTGVILPPKN